MPIIEETRESNTSSTLVKSLKTLPNGFHLRPLLKEDYHNGYLQCLSQLTSVGTISEEQFIDRLNYMGRNDDKYFPMVAIDGNGKVAGCGTLLVEHKFIHNCGKLGHIEDIVVRSDLRGTGLGKIIIEELKVVASREGCYKITLDCDASNENFYGKCSFVTKGLQMVIYN